MKKIYFIVLFLMGGSGLFAQVPNCVTNNLPANGATGISVTPVLTWQPNPNATSYNLFFGNNSNPTTLVANVTSSSFTISSPLSSNSTFYWYVVPKNANGNAIGCINNITSFTTAPLSCTQNILPANNATGVNVNTALTWQPVLGASSYIIYLGTNSNPANMIGNTSTNSFNISNSNNSNPLVLLPNTTYYWYVVPKNGNISATGCINSLTSFTTAALACSNNILPANNSINIGYLPSLSWEPCLGATKYDVYLGNSPSNTPLIGSTSSNTFLQLLQPNTTYYWYVVPKWGAGFQLIQTTGCQNNTTSFTTAPFNCIAPISPANNSTVGTKLKLKWETTPLANRYDIYFGTAPNPPLFSSGITTDEIVSFTPLLTNTIYYWKVVAKKGISDILCTSITASFTTAQLSCVANIFPTNNSTGTSVTPTLNWQGDTVALNYDLYLGTNSNPTNLFANVPSYTYSGNAYTEFYSIPNNSALLPNTIYYWYAVPKNSNASATGCLSNVSNFTTSPLSCTINNSPLHNSTQVSLLPTLNWQPISAALSYDVFLGPNSTSTTLISNTTTTNYTFLNSNMLLPNTTYYWYIIPKNGNFSTTGCASTITSFTTAPLTCVQYVAPINNSFDVKSSIATFQWEWCKGANNYDIYIGTNATNLTLAANVIADNNTFGYYNKVLLPNTTYYWYIIPKYGNIAALNCENSIQQFTTAPLLCIANISPANNSVGVNKFPTLTWQPSLATNSYYLYFGTTNNPTNMIATVYNSNSYTIPANNSLLVNTTYYWYVVPFITGGASATGCQSTVTSFSTTPNCTFNTLPLNNSINLTYNPILKWQSSSLTNSYDIYLDTNPVPTTKIDSNYNSASYQMYSGHNLLPNTTYYWYVVPKIGTTGAINCASTVTSFTTAALNCVQNLSPTNNGTQISIYPLLIWESNYSATSFDIYLGTNINTLTLLQNTISTSVILTTPLLPNTIYYWYVLPKNGILSATGCGNTHITSFTTASISCIQNMIPTINSVGVSTRPTFYWHTNYGANNYDIYMGTSSTSTTLLLNTGNGHYTNPSYDNITSYSYPNNLPPLLANTTYYWYIVPKNGNIAATGCTSNITSFTTYPLSCVTNNLPANNSTGVSFTPTLSWQTNPIASSYDIYMGTSNNNTTYLANASTNSYSIPNINALIPNTNYYWYVVPKSGNALATGCASTITNFTTLPLSCVVNSSPLNNSTGLNVLPNLSWQANTAATSYDIYLGTTNNPTTLLANVSTTNFTLPSSNALLPNTTYYWYVVPKNGNLMATGCNTNVTNFTTASLSCSVNSTPSNASISNNVRPTLSWIVSASATNYDIYLGTSNTNPALFANVNTNTYTIPPNLVLLPNTTYYWYVIPKNGSFFASGCINNMTSFKTQAISCVTNISPSNNSTNMVSPYFGWSYNSVATNYDLYLGTTNPPTTVVANTTSLNYNLTQNNLLQESTTYYWYVVPKNGDSSAIGCASSVTSFTTIPSICIPQYTFNCGDVNAAIMEFNLLGETGTSISTSTSVCSSAPYYTNLTASSNVNLAINKAYVGNMKLNGINTISSIWIDFNDNGGFEINECVLSNLRGVFSNATLAYSIYIPTNSNLGEHIMRVRSAYGINPNIPMRNCESYYYGETKDFKVTIVASGSPYIISSKTNCENLAITSINTATSNINIAVPILDNVGHLAATINANGNNLGLIYPSLYRNTGAVRQSYLNGPYYLDRNITIGSTLQPTSGNVSVRLYYTAAELAAFQTSVPSATTNSLNVTKNNQPCSSTFVGPDVFLPQTGNGTYGSDYYIDISTPSVSSFFIKNGLGILPVKIDYFKGSKQQDHNLLNWKINCDVGSNIYVTLEHSVDGIKFNNLLTQNISNIMCQYPFTYKDYNAVTGSNYYRLKLTSSNGEIKYSEILKILNKAKGFELISMVPNPIKNNGTVIISSATGGKVNIAVSDVMGKIVLNKTVLLIAGSNNVELRLENIAGGIYFIKAINDDGELKTLRFVKY